jgi:hypothetical protein
LIEREKEVQSDGDRKRVASENGQLGQGTQGDEQEEVNGIPD